MRKLIAWGGAALFIAVVMAIIYRVPQFRGFVTGTKPSA